MIEAAGFRRDSTSRATRPMNPKAVRSGVSGFYMTNPCLSEPCTYNGTYINTYRFATEQALAFASGDDPNLELVPFGNATQDLNGGECDAGLDDFDLGPTCYVLPGPSYAPPGVTPGGSGGTAYTSDYTVMQLIALNNSMYGEQYQFIATDPYNNQFESNIWTYYPTYQGYNNCFVASSAGCTGNRQPYDCCTGSGVGTCEGYTFCNPIANLGAIFAGPGGTVPGGGHALDDPVLRQRQ